MKKENLAILMNDLQVPLVVSDILAGREQLDDNHYALSEMISDMRMDQALITIAVSMRMIVEPYIKASPTLQAVFLHAKKVIEDVSYDYMASSSHEDSLVVDAMDGISEDLEYMSELLSLSMNFFRAKDDLAVSLCRMLKAQADSHHLIAEMFLCQPKVDKVLTGGQNNISDMYKEPVHNNHSSSGYLFGSDNIVPFQAV